MAFQYKAENGVVLTTSQESLLESIENYQFPFDVISKLKDLRQRSGISVIISDRKSLIRVLKDSVRAIERKIEEFKGSRLISNPNIEGEIYDRKRWAEKQLEVAKNSRLGETPLLGLYTRKLLWFDNSAPVVYLFADNIRDYAKRKSVNEDNVFAFVFVHEMMHAYYDAFNSEGFPCKERIEEAFAEFGMLSFLQSFGQRTLFTDARDEVISEIQDGPREYGFGLELFNKSGANGIKMINRYKEISNWIDSSVVRTFPSQGSGNYFSDFSDYDKKWDDTNANNCFKDIQIILNYPWQQPTIVIQQRIKKVLANTQQRRYTSLVISPHQTIEQVDLVSDSNIKNVFVAIIRLLKLFDFESKLSFDGPNVTYAGERLFFYSSTADIPNKRPTEMIGCRVVPESICVNGIIVFPMFRFYPGRLYALKKLVRLLCDVSGETFTIVYDSGRLNIYGPPLSDEYISVLNPNEPRYEKFSYDIIVKATSEMLCQDESISRIPFIVVKHFCESNKDVTWADLQRIFDKVEYLGPKFLDWITPKPIVDAFYASFPRSLQRFHKDPITLASGETILVASHSIMSNSIDYKSFIEVSDSLGYEIRKHK